MKAWSPGRRSRSPSPSMCRPADPARSRTRSNNPALALEVETFPGQVKKWGLTFLINTEDVKGFRSAGSLTWGGVHNTYFWIDLKKRITAVALMQILPIGDPFVQETMIAFERTLYAAVSASLE